MTVHRPTMFFEVAEDRIHCEAANGQDYTLCGFTLDGDQGKIVEVAGSRITCPDCLGIIQFCRNLEARSFQPRARHAG